MQCGSKTHRVASYPVAKIVTTCPTGCVQVTRRIVGVGHATGSEDSLSHRLHRSTYTIVGYVYTAIIQYVIAEYYHCNSYRASLLVLFIVRW